MKKLVKIFSSRILPIITLITFIIIGGIKNQLIAAEEGLHRTMSGVIEAIAWSLRGIYVAILIKVFSSVLYSELNKLVKIAVFLLMVVLNFPLIYFMDLAPFFPLALLIAIPLVNFIVYIPILVSRKVKKEITKLDESNDKLE
ncbi:hypothetical protein ACN077_04245 [Clostridium chromiireducens]